MKSNATLVFNQQISTQKNSLTPWIVCFAASLFFFYEFIQMNMFNAINASLMAEFSLTAGMLGKLSATYFYANVLFLLPAGYLLDRLSTKKIITTSLLICLIGTVLFSLATTLAWLTFCRFITGIGSAFCFLSCMRLASRWFPKERMALLSGLIVTMAMMGGLAAQVPMALLVEHSGWRQALQFDALLGAFILLLILFLVKDYPPDLHKEFSNEKANLVQYGQWNSLKQAFLSRQNWLCGIYTSLLNLPLFLLGGLWGTLYLTRVHHFTGTQSTFMTSMIFLGTIIGAPLMGWLSDQLGTRKKPMIVGALLSLLLFFLILYIPSLSFGSLLTLFLLLGFVTSTQVISYPVVTESNPRMLTATCVSVVSLCAISGGAIFEPLFGRLMDYHWSGTIVEGVRQYAVQDFQFAMRLFPITLVIALVAAMLIKSKSKG